jgi:hypothetical protein
MSTYLSTVRLFRMNQIFIAGLQVSSSSSPRTEYNRKISISTSLSRRKSWIVGEVYFSDGGIDGSGYSCR